MTQRSGASFETAQVVDLYHLRPPYPGALFQAILNASPARGALLDIGCGPGKMARPLAPSFAHVTAVDPSVQMLELGRGLPGGDAPNIVWVHGLAEDAVYPRPFYDTVVAALSLHWMDQPRLFARLSHSLRPNHLIAIVNGDQAFEPPWEADWQTFLRDWVPRITGAPLRAKTRAMARSAKYIDVMARQHLISDPIQQSVEDFILCQHSRDTFALSKLGDRRAAFDDELRALLAPHARDGVLEFRVGTQLTLACLAL